MDQPPEPEPDFGAAVREADGAIGHSGMRKVVIPIGHPPGDGPERESSAVDELRTLTRLSAENADLRTENAKLRAILAGRPARDPILDLVDLSKTLAQALVNLSEGK